MNEQWIEILKQIKELNEDNRNELFLSILDIYGPQSIGIRAVAAYGCSPCIQGESFARDIVLTKFKNKVLTVKLIREIASKLNLVSAFELINNLPALIISNIDQFTAEKIKIQFEDIGATIEIKKQKS